MQDTCRQVDNFPISLYSLLTDTQMVLRVVVNQLFEISNRITVHVHVWNAGGPVCTCTRLHISVLGSKDGFRILQGERGTK